MKRRKAELKPDQYELLKKIKKTKLLASDDDRNYTLCMVLEANLVICKKKYFSHSPPITTIDKNLS